MLAEVTIGARQATTERRRPGDSVDLRAQAEEIVWAATRAPSYRNTQPWLFHVAARQVEVYADRSRRCAVADPDGRELFLSLGAAVFGVRLAMSRLRVRPVVGLSRDRAHPDLAAVVVAAGRSHAPDEDDRLYDELDRRRTIWTPFVDGPVPVELEVELADRIRHEGATARWLRRSDTRRMVTDLARRTAVDRLADAEPRLEAVRCPTANQSSPAPAPALLLICSPNDHRADWLRAGQALHHALLAASAAGIAASFQSQLLDVPLLREQLRNEVDLPGRPQVLLELGRAGVSVPPPSPRRPLAEVLVRRGPSTLPGGP
jgi:nitroreductase